MLRRLPAAAVVAVAVLALDAVLLAWVEMAWLPVRVGVVPLPLTALGAAITTPLLVLAAGAALPRTQAPMVPLAAWTLTVLVAGLWSPAGAGVLPPDWRTLLLLAGGLVPGVWAVTRRRPAAPPRGPDAVPAD